MFDKRLMLMCPESKKYILGNILLQFLELCLNALMIVTIALSVQRLYDRTWMLQNLPLPLLLILCTVILRFLTTRYAVRMSYLASRTVKRVMREKIYGKLLRLGTSYREHVTTAELVQEAVEGVDQLESYFGQYVPQFFYAFMAPIALFFLFGFGGSWRVAAVLLICVPLIPGAIMMVQKIAKKILAKYWGQYTQLGSTFLENLQGMTTLKTYQADACKNVEMNKESEHFRKVTMSCRRSSGVCCLAAEISANGSPSGFHSAGPGCKDLPMRSCSDMPPSQINGWTADAGKTPGNLRSIRRGTKTESVCR